MELRPIRPAQYPLCGPPAALKIFAGGRSCNPFPSTGVSPQKMGEDLTAEAQKRRDVLPQKL
jgi:hypothetical protein